jgi:hypothetical protein
MGVGEEALGHHLQQPQLDVERCLARGQTGAVADAEDMGVHRDRQLAEGDVQHHVGRLAADAGQRFERFPGARHLAAVLLDQDAAGFVQVPGLAAEQADGPDVRLDAFDTERAHLLRRRRQREQGARGLVDTDVGGLGRQQHGGEQLEHAAVDQFRGGLRVGVAKGREEGVDVGALHALAARSRARCIAASISARLRSSVAGSVSVLAAARSASLASAFVARR